MAVRELKIVVTLETNEADYQIKQLAKEVDDAKGEFILLGNSSNSALRDMSKAFYDLGRNGGIKTQNKNLEAMAKATGMSVEEIERLIQKMDKDTRLDNEFREAARAAGLTEREVSKLKSSIDSAKETTASWKGIMSGLASIGLTAAAGLFVKSGVKQAAEFEDLNVQFKVLMGSADAATKTIADLQKFAGSTPFESDEVIKAGRSLLAVKVPADQLVDTLTMIGDVSKGSGKNFNELATIFAKNKSSNFIQGEDLNQLIEAGIPILDEFSKMFGKTAIQVKEMGSKNQIEFKHLQQAFRNMTKEGGIYAGMMKELSKTSLGMWSTISDGIKQISKSIGSAILGVFKPLLEFFSDAERGTGRLQFAFTVLAIAIGVGLVLATRAWIASLDEATLAAIRTYAAMLGPALIVVAKLVAIYLVLEDIWTFFEYGPYLSNTYFGDLLKWLGLTDDELQALSNGWRDMKDVFGDAWNQIVEWFKNPVIKYTLIAIAGLIFAIAFPAIALGAVLFALKVLIAVALIAAVVYFVARWNSIWASVKAGWLAMTDWISEKFNAMLNFMKEYAGLAGKLIVTFLFPIAGLYLFREEIASLFGFVWNWIKSIDWSAIWVKAKEAFSYVGTYIKEAWNSIWDKMGAVFDMSNIKAFLVGSLNDAINSINTAMRDVPGIKHVWKDIPLIEQREKGGEVLPGVPYIVGEKGPELRVFDSPGSIIPNNQLQSSNSGNSSIVFNASFSINGNNDEQLALNAWEKLRQLVSDNANSIRTELGLVPIYG